MTTKKETEVSDIEKTLEERGTRYGDFSDHAAIAQSIQDAMRGTSGWQKLTPVMKQALSVIADKQARILSGDPHYKDNWHDIQGYAKLAEDRCADTSAPQLPLDNGGLVNLSGFPVGVNQ